MKSFLSEYWQIDLPDDWQAEQVDDSISIYDPQSSGTLLFSTVREEQEITDEFLAELASEHIEADADFYEVEYGPFDGVTCCYQDDTEYWCEWYLKYEDVMLFITYNCPLEDEGKEDDLVETILESLHGMTPGKMH